MSETNNNNTPVVEQPSEPINVVDYIFQSQKEGKSFDNIEQGFQQMHNERIPRTFDVDYDKYSKLGFGKEKMDSIKTNAETAFYNSGVKRFYQQDKVVSDTPHSRYLEKYLDTEFNFGPLRSHVFEGDPLGWNKGVKYLTDAELRWKANPIVDPAYRDRLLGADGKYKQPKLVDGIGANMLIDNLTGNTESYWDRREGYDKYGNPVHVLTPRGVEDYRTITNTTWGQEKMSYNALESITYGLWNFAIPDIMGKIPTAIARQLNYISYSVADTLRSFEETAVDEFYKYIDRSTSEGQKESLYSVFPRLEGFNSREIKRVDPLSKYHIKSPTELSDEEKMKKEYDYIKSGINSYSNFWESQRMNTSEIGQRSTSMFGGDPLMQISNVIGQSIVQVGITYATGNPWAGLQFGMLQVGGHMDHEMGKANVPDEWRLPIYLAAMGVTLGTEKLLMMGGLRPIYEMAGKGMNVQQAMRHTLIEQIERNTGVTAKYLTRVGTKDRNMFMNGLSKAFSREGLYTGMKMTEIMTREGIGEGLQETSEGILHSFLTHTYDHINQDTIEQQKRNPELYESNRQKFIADIYEHGAYDVSKSMIDNYIKNTFKARKLVPEFVYGFIGGVSGGLYGRAYQTLSKDPSLKPKRHTTAMGLNIMANFDLEVLQKQFENLPAIDFDFVDGNTGNTMTYAKEGEVSKDQMAKQSFWQDILATNKIGLEMGLDRISPQGDILGSTPFAEDVIGLYSKLVVAETKLQEYNKLTTDDRTVGKEESEQETAGLVQEINDIKKEIKRYTDPIELNRPVVYTEPTFSAKGHEKILTYYLNKKLVDEQIEQYKDEYLKQLKARKIKYGSKKEAEFRNVLAAAQFTNMQGKYRYVAMKYMNDPLVNKVLNEKGENAFPIRSIQESIESSTGNVTTLSELMTGILNEYKSTMMDTSLAPEALPSLEEVIAKVDSMGEMVAKDKQYEKQFQEASLEDPSVVRKMLTEQEIGVKQQVENFIKSLKTKFGIESIFEDTVDLRSGIANAIMSKFDGTQGVRLVLDKSIQGTNNILKGLNELFEIVDEKETQELWTSNQRTYKLKQKNANVREGNTLLVTEINSKNMGISEYALASISEAMDTLSQNLFEYDKDGKPLLDASGNMITKKGDETAKANIEQSMSAINMLQEIYRNKVLFDAAIKSAPDNAKIGRNKDETRKTYKEDVLDESLNAKEIASNKKAEEMIEKLSNGQLNQFGAIIEETMRFIKDKIDLIRTRDVIMGLEFWMHFAMDEGKIRSNIENTLHSKEVGLDISGALNRLQVIYDQLLAAQKDGNFGSSLKILPELRGEILSILNDISSNIYEVYNSKNEAARGKINEFIDYVLHEENFDVVEQGMKQKANQVEESYFLNFNIYDLLNPEKQGLLPLGQNIVNSAAKGKYNGAYHWSINYLHRTINSNANATTKLLDGIIKKIANERVLGDEKLSKDLKIPSAEQFFSLYDMLNSLQSKKMNNYVFEVNDRKFKIAIGLFKMNNGMQEALSLKEAQEYIKTEPDETIRKRIIDAIDYYKGTIYATVDADGPNPFMSNAIMQTGNAGTGKTMMTGFNILAFAVSQKEKYNKDVTILLVAPDGISSGTEGLTYESEQEIRRYVDAYNSAMVTKKNKLNITIQRTTTQQVFSNKANDLIGSASLVVFDESGRFEYSDMQFLNSLQQSVNVNMEEGSIKPFYFLGDNQQIAKTENNGRYGIMPVQGLMVNTVPFQYSFRTGNTEVIGLMNTWGERVFSGMTINNSKVPDISLYSTETNGKLEGGKYYANIYKIIDEYFKRASVVGKEAVLIFTTQKEYTEYTSKYKNKIKALSEAGKLNIRILYNNVTSKVEGELATAQGKQFNEVFIAIPQEVTQGSTATGRATSMYTSVSRAKSFVALVGNTELNRDKPGNYKNLTELSAENRKEDMLIQSNIIKTELHTGENGNNLNAGVVKKIYSPKTETVKDEDVEVVEEVEEGTEDVVVEEGEDAEIIDETTEEESAIEETEETIPEDNITNEESLDDGSDIAYEAGNGKVVIGTQSEVVDADGETNIKLKNGLSINPNQKNNVEEAVRRDEQLSVDEKIAKVENEVSVYNLPVYNGSLSETEYNNLSAENRHELFAAMYFASKSNILSALINGELKLNEKNNKERFIRIEYSNTPEKFVSFNKGVLSISDNTYSPIRIMVNLNAISDIKLLKLGIKGNVLTEMKKQGDWIQLGYLYSFQSDYTNEDTGVQPLNLFEASRETMEQRFDKYIKGNTKVVVDNFYNFIQSLKGGGIAMTISEFKSSFKTEGPNVQFIGDRTIKGSGSWVLPADNIKVTDKAKYVKNGRQGVVLKTQSGRYILGSSMTLLQKIQYDQSYEEVLLAQAKKMMEIIDGLGDTKLSKEDFSKNIRNNILYRMYHISANRSALEISMKGSTVNFNNDKEAIYNLAQVVTSMLEEGTNMEEMGKYYIPLYNTKGEIELSNILVGAIPNENMFFRMDNIGKEKPATPEQKLNNKNQNNNLFKKETRNTALLTQSVVDEAVSMIGQNEYDGIVFKDDLSEFGDKVAGVLSNGTIYVKSKNSYIVENVLRHEIFHKVLRHGITRESYYKVLEDYMNNKIQADEIVLDDVLDEDGNIDYLALEEMAATEFETIQPIETKPTSLIGKLWKFVTDFVSKMFGKYNNNVQVVSTYSELVKNVFDGVYANNLNLNLNQNYTNAYMENSMEDFVDNFTKEQLETMIDEWEDVVTIPINVSEIFDSTEERIVVERFIRRSLLSKTILSQLKPNEVNKSNLNTIEEAVEEYKQEFDAYISDPNNLEEIEELSKLTAYDLIQRPNTSIDSFIFSKIVGSTNIAENKEEAQNKIDIFTNFLYPNISKNRAANRQFMPDGLVSINETSSFEMNKILTSLVTHKYIVSLDEVGDAILDFDSQMKGNVPIGNIPMNKLRTEITFQKNVGNLELPLDIREQMQVVAKLISDIAKSNARLTDNEHLNSVAFQMQTLSDYILESLLTRINSPETTIEQLAEIQSFWLTFLSHVLSTSKDSHAIATKNGFIKRGLGDLSSFKKKIENRVKEKTMENNSIKSYIVRQYETNTSDANFSVFAQDGKLYLRDVKGTIIAEMNINSEGNAEFNLKAKPELLRNELNRLFNWIGIRTSENQISQFMKNEQIFESKVQEALKKGTANMFLPVTAMSMIAGLQLGSKQQAIRNYLNLLNVVSENETEKNEVKGTLRTLTDSLIDIVYNNYDNSDADISSKIDAIVKDIEDSLDGYIASTMLKTQQKEKIMNNINSIKNILPYYTKMLGAFNGISNIKDDYDNQSLAPSEQEERSSEMTSKSYSPKPLDFDIALNVFHSITEFNTIAPDSIYINNRVYHLLREDANVNEQLSKYVGNYDNKSGNISKELELVKYRASQGIPMSQIFNPILNGIIDITDRYEVSEIKIDKQSETDPSIDDVIVSFLNGLVDSGIKGNVVVAETVKGDNNKTFVYEVKSEHSKPDINDWLNKGNTMDSNSTITDEFKFYTEQIKDIFMSYHVQHVKSISNFIDSVETLVSMPDISISKYEVLLGMLEVVKGNARNIINNPYSREEVLNYNYNQTLLAIEDVLNILNTELPNTYNRLIELGLKNDLDIKLKDGKAIMGNALSFNNKRRIKKDGSLLGVYTPTDLSYNGYHMYRHAKIVQEVKKGLEGQKITVDTLEIKQSKQSILEQNPKTMEDVFNLLYNLYSSDLFNMQVKINELIYNNKIDKNVRKLLDVEGDNIVFFKKIATEVSKKQKTDTYKINWNMMSNFVYSHIVNKAMGHLMHGHDLEYGTASNLSNRNKLAHTPGRAAVPTSVGLSENFGVIVLSDAVVNQAVLEFNIGNSTYKLNENKIVQLTDGQTRDTYIGRHYSNISFGGTMSDYTANDQKTLYFDYDITTDETTIQKHAAHAITKDYVDMNPNLVALEYIALKNLDTDIANNFKSMYLNNLNSGLNYGEAFDKAAKDTIKIIDNTPDLDKNRLVVQFTHPTAVKIGRTYANQLTAQDIMAQGIESTIEPFAMTFKTNKLRQIFNPDTDIKNSKGEMLFKQGFWLLQGLLSNEDASSVENTLAGLIESNLREIGMLADGTVSSAGALDIVKNALNVLNEGMMSSGQIGSTLELSRLAVENENLLQLPIVSAKVIQTVNKTLNNLSSKLRYNGGSYNQISDDFVNVYEATINFKEGNSININVVGEGGKLRLENKFKGIASITYSEARSLNEMKQSEEGVQKGEAILQTVNQHKFGIVDGVSMIDAALIKAGDTYIDIRQVDEDGMYNGKKVTDNKGNIVGLEESVILKSEQRNGFKSDLDMITKFNKSLQIMLFRKPTSLLTSGGVYNIIDFLHNDNNVIVSAKKNAWDDSDFDIDKLYGYEYDFTNDAKANAMNSILEKMEKAFDVLALSKLLNVSISTDSLKAMITKELIYKSGTPNTMWSSFNTQEKMQMGKDSISRWANVQVTAGILAKVNRMPNAAKDMLVNSQYNGQFKDAYSIVQNILNDEVTYNKYVQNAIMLQASVDNNKNPILGELGMDMYSINEIVAMQYAGMSLNDVIEFLKNPLVQDVYRQINKAHSMSGRNDIRSVFLYISDWSIKNSEDKSPIVKFPNEITGELFNTLSSEAKVLTRDDFTEDEFEAMLLEAKPLFTPSEEQTKDSIGFRVLQGYKRGRNKMYDLFGESQATTSDAGLLKQLEDKSNKQMYAYSEFIQHEDMLRRFAYNKLQNFAVVGEILRDITFLSKIIDGVASKEFDFESNKYNIEKHFGMDLGQILLEEGNTTILKHDKNDTDRIVNYDLENNDFYKKMDVNLQKGYEMLRRETVSMFKIGNLMTVMPLLRVYGQMYRFANEIASETITLRNKGLNKDYVNRLMLANSKGRYTSNVSMFNLKNSWTSTLISEALNNMVKSNTMLEKDGYGKNINLSIANVSEETGDLTLNDFNGTYDAIDITNSKGGREIFIKRMPSYIMAYSDMINSYYNARSRESYDIKDKIERQLITNYKMTKEEIDNIYNNMLSYNGDSFANYIDTIGSDFNNLLVLKESMQLSQDAAMYDHVKRLFKNMPQRIKDLLSLYEVTVNGLSVKKNSLYDIIDISFLEKLSNYMPSEKHIRENLTFEKFLDNVSTVDGILSPIVKENNNSMNNMIKQSIEKYGAKNSNGVKYGYVKFVTKEPINNSYIHFKKILLTDFTDKSTFDQLGHLVFNTGVKNALPFSFNEEITKRARAIKNLNEKNIFELNNYGTTTIELYRGHNFNEKTDMTFKDKHPIVYMTNAGIPVTIVHIGDRYIVISRTTAQELGQTNIVSKIKTKSFNQLSIDETIEIINENSNTIKEEWERPEGSNYYHSKSNKHLVALSVSSIVDQTKYGEMSEAKRDVILSDGNVGDRTMKSLVEYLINNNKSVEEVINEINDMVKNKDYDNIVPLQAFLEAVDELYSKARASNASLDPMFGKRNDPEAMIKEGVDYVISLLNSNLKNQINYYKKTSLGTVKVLRDIRLHGNYNGNMVMGEFDFAFVYKHGKNRNTVIDIIDIKTSDISTTEKKQKIFTNAFNQINTYLDLFSQNYSKIKNNNNSVYHVPKLSNFVNSTKNTGLHVETQKAYAEKVTEYMNNIDKLVEEMSAEISSNTKEDINLTSNILLAEKLASETEC